MHWRKEGGGHHLLFGQVAIYTSQTGTNGPRPDWLRERNAALLPEFICHKKHNVEMPAAKLLINRQTRANDSTIGEPISNTCGANWNRCRQILHFMQDINLLPSIFDFDKYKLHLY